MMATPPINNIAMAWFRREDWNDLLAIFDDPQVMPATYDKWLEKAEAGFRFHKSRGAIVKKIYINPQTFPDWCRRRGLRVDADARTTFAVEEFTRGINAN